MNRSGKDKNNNADLRIGVISDTHGYINPKVFEVFEGVDQILHAGDIGNEDVITSLEAVAPVQAIHGNIDTFPLRSRYPDVLTLDIRGVAICLIHEFRGLQDPLLQARWHHLSKPKPDVVIFGHSHQATLEKEGDVVLFNPGAAGKRRFNLRPAVGLLTITEDGAYTPEIVYLDEQ